MTGSEDDHSNTRPISVAELLARNGTIGAPPVGGRRRRRRGNADAVTVAELTGEIPIVRPDDQPPVAAEPEPESQPEPEPELVPEPEPEAAAETEPEAETEPDAAAEPEAETEPDAAADGEAASEAESDDLVDREVDREEDVTPDEDAAPGAIEEVPVEAVPDDGEYADAGADPSAHVAEREAEREVAPEPTRRFGFSLFGRKNQTVDAEQWTPDPVDEDARTSGPSAEAATESDADLLDGDAPEIEDLDDEIALTTDLDAHPDTGFDTDIEEDDAVERALDEDEDEDELPSYLRSTEEPLFGGPSADSEDRDAVIGTADRDELDRDELDRDEFERDELDEEHGEPRRMSSFVSGLWIVGQSVIAVIFGAGLFVAFDQLWKWNNIVALVLSVLVILGLVVGVRVVRKTEDIGSTLIAVAVGALVTLGPLALLQSG
ncbi:hypothetical protein ACTWP6_24835 [Mycobacterium sp. 4D054]|uniref:hypothetical protein n=1 Tax=Mycobacterium sp. 4D054 TaxID=3457440 RepID=UPI003FD19FF0